MLDLEEKLGECDIVKKKLTSEANLNEKSLKEVIANLEKVLEVKNQGIGNLEQEIADLKLKFEEKIWKLENERDGLAKEKDDSHRKLQINLQKYENELEMVQNEHNQEMERLKQSYEKEKRHFDQEKLLLNNSIQNYKNIDAQNKINTQVTRYLELILKVFCY